MRYFILALILHGLLFFKLCIPSKKNMLSPVKHSVVIHFQEIKTTSPTKILQKEGVEKKVTSKKEIKKEIKEIKHEEVKKTIVKKKTTKKNIKKKKKEDNKIKNNIIEEKKKKSFSQNENISSEKLPSSNSILKDNKDGTYTALSDNGIKYKILKEVEAIYPKQAENIGYRKKVIVKAKFLVDENGEVKNISIVQSHKKLGFDDAVISALKKWKFTPIYYDNKIIKVYFQKEFIFEAR